MIHTVTFTLGMKEWSFCFFETTKLNYYLRASGGCIVANSIRFPVWSDTFV